MNGCRRGCLCIPGAVLTCRVSIRLCTFPGSSSAGMGRMRTRMGTLCTAEMCWVWMLLSSASAMAVAAGRPRPSAVVLSRALRSAPSSAAPSRTPLLPPCPAIVTVTASAPLFCRVTGKGQGRLPGRVPEPAGPLPAPESLRSGLPSAPPSHGTPMGMRLLSPPPCVLGVPVLPPESLGSHLAGPGH